MLSDLDRPGTIHVTRFLFLVACFFFGIVAVVPPQASDLEDLSKTLFGQIHRLAVMVAIARSDGRVNPTELAADLGFTSLSAIQSSMRDLETAGLLVRESSESRKTYYLRQQSHAWPLAIELAEQAAHSDRATSR